MQIMQVYSIPTQGRVGFEEMVLQAFNQRLIQRYLQVYIQEPAAKEQDALSSDGPEEQKKSSPADDVDKIR